MLFFPYSNEYSTLSTSAGNFPGFLAGTNPAPILYAIAAPKIKPLASAPTT
jgi:hypothetical protein